MLKSIGYELSHVHLYLYMYVEVTNSGFSTTVREPVTDLLTQTVEGGLEGLDRLSAYDVIVQLVPLDDCIHKER